MPLNPEEASDATIKGITMQYKFSELANIKTNHPDADFWLQRKGSENNIGKPTKVFHEEHIGIKVTKRNVLNADYCYYALENLFNTGYWQTVSCGTLRLQHITVKMVKNLVFGG